MTRYFNAIVVGLCFFATSGASVQASIQVGDKIKLGDGPGSPGGIFRIDDLNDSPQWNFDSFCVELEEYVNFNTIYVVENIALKTNQGNRTLQSFTAWLYNSYLDQTLSGFNFASPTAQDANTLQYAIWKSMGYSDAAIGASWSATYNPLLAGKGWANAFAASTWSGTGNIYIMNLRTFDSAGRYTGYAQDQLVRVPGSLPEPMSLAVWSFLGAVGGAGGIPIAAAGRIVDEDVGWAQLASERRPTIYCRSHLPAAVDVGWAQLAEQRAGPPSPAAATCLPQ